ncbi:MAG: hypothetical protein WA982_15625 [Rubrobacteraceae bacterium]
MSERSLPPFGVFGAKLLPFSLVKRVASRLGKNLRRARPEETPAPAPELRSRATAAIREYADSHSALFERAERLRERAERLNSEGTPSDTALNRAERAESEVAVELANLRTRFLKAADSREEELAFDQEVRALYPAIQSLYR